MLAGNRILLALSIVAPSGTSIAFGRKTLEVRSWRPETLPLTDLLIVENGRFLSAHGDSDDDGRLVAVVDIAGVQPWLPTEVEPACATAWAPGYWAWRICNVRRIASPLKVVAARKLYDVPLDPNGLALLFAQ
jgi:hypothetical protein